MNLLGKAIQDMNIRRGKKDHANFVLILQSSGTGKSRVVDELAKYIFTIPLNLRPSKDIGTLLVLVWVKLKLKQF